MSTEETALTVKNPIGKYVENNSRVNIGNLLARVNCKETHELSDWLGSDEKKNSTKAEIVYYLLKFFTENGGDPRRATILHLFADVPMQEDLIEKMQTKGAEIPAVITMAHKKCKKNAEMLTELNEDGLLGKLEETDILGSNLQVLRHLCPGKQGIELIKALGQIVPKLYARGIPPKQDALKADVQNIHKTVEHLTLLEIEQTKAEHADDAIKQITVFDEIKQVAGWDQWNEIISQIGKILPTAIKQIEEGNEDLIQRLNALVCLRRKIAYKGKGVGRTTKEGVQTIDDEIGTVLDEMIKLSDKGKNSMQTLNNIKRNIFTEEDTEIIRVIDTKINKLAEIEL